MYTSSRTLWTAFKEAIELYQVQQAVNLLSPVRRNERDSALFVEGLCEEIRAREPIHVARDRQAEEVQERWRNVNHRTATLTRCDDRRPLR